MIILESKFDSLNQEKYEDYSDKNPFHAGVNHGNWKNKMLAWGGESHRNRQFNQHIYKLITNHPIKILDIGCGGGGFIEDCVNDGHCAIGLDGNKFYKDLSLQSWQIIKNNLFTCDIGQDFTILEDDKIIQFDIITTFEFLEHIHPEDINTVMSNIKKHSKYGTYLLYTASSRPDRGHLTIKSKEEWTNLFNEIGYKNINLDFGKDFIRNEPDSIKGYMIYEDYRNRES